MKEASGSQKSEVRSQKWSRFAFINVILMFLAFSAHAQISGKSIPELRREAAGLQYLPIVTRLEAGSNFPSFYFSHFPSVLKAKTPTQKPTVPILYSYDHLAFFCKIEVQLEKAVKLPIKFRLGDVEYVDRLEGKRQ